MTERARDVRLFFLPACLLLAAPRAFSQAVSSAPFAVAADSTTAGLVVYDAAGSRLPAGRGRASPRTAGRAAPASSPLSVSDAYAYPVPFRPHGPQAGTGPGHTGTDSEGITFTQLPPQGGIDVYNVRGERVWHGDFGDGSGAFAWNTLASSGQPAASGVYLYVITGPQDKKVGKLSIIR